MEGLQALLHPSLPYLDLIYAFLWPELLGLASACSFARRAAAELAQRAMAAALGPDASLLLRAPWLVIQQTFSRKQLAVVVGGYSRPRDVRLFCFPPGRHSHCSVKRVPPLPVLELPARSLAWKQQLVTACCCCGCVFVFPAVGGGGEPMLRFDLLREAWHKCQAPLNARACGLTAKGGKLVATGGYGDRRVHQYEAAADLWTKLLHMPFMRYNHGSVEFEGFLVVAGGSCSASSMIAPSSQAGTEHDIRRSVLQYGAEDEWVQLAPTRQPRDRCELHVAAGALFVTGGSQHDTRRSIEKYDSSTDHWTLIFSERPPGALFPSVALADRFILFGQREAGKVIDIDHKGNIVGRRAHFLSEVEGFVESYGDGNVSPSERYDPDLDLEFLGASVSASPLGLPLILDKVSRN